MQAAISNGTSKLTGTVKTRCGPGQGRHRQAIGQGNDQDDQQGQSKAELQGHDRGLGKSKGISSRQADGGQLGRAGKTKKRETATGRRTEGDGQQMGKKQPRFQN